MRKGEVYIHDKRAGVIVETDSPREYVFTYYPEYIADHDNPEVCLAMPLRSEPYRSPYLFPFFFNMLSEGANRKIQSTLHRISINDDFGIMLATAGNDTAGAVTVKPLDS